MTKTTFKNLNKIIENNKLEMRELPAPEERYPATTLETRNVLTYIEDVSYSVNQFGYVRFTGTLYYGVDERHMKSWNFSEKAGYLVLTTMQAWLVEHSDYTAKEAQLLTRTEQGIDALIEEFNKANKKDAWLTADYRITDDRRIVWSQPNLIAPEKKEREYLD